MKNTNYRALNDRGIILPIKIYAEEFNERAKTYTVKNVNPDLFFKNAPQRMGSDISCFFSNTLVEDHQDSSYLELVLICREHKVLILISGETSFNKNTTEIFYSDNTPAQFIKELISLAIESKKGYGDDYKGCLDMIVSDNGFLEFKEFKVLKPEIDLDKIYPSDFKNTHEKILSSLNTTNSKGLIILHGEPGTGKTTYIRHLISNTPKKKIFVSPHMASVISDPSFISLLGDRKDSILIIEDAESVLMTRDQSRNDAVSNLLNLSDGLLADCFNIQIICTFNTPLRNIDPALLRKGRLITRYEFPKLTKERAKAIAKRLGSKIDIKEDISLADLYNHEDNVEPQKATSRKSKIGFDVIESDKS